MREKTLAFDGGGRIRSTRQPPRRALPIPASPQRQYLPNPQQQSLAVVWLGKQNPESHVVIRLILLNQTFEMLGVDVLHQKSSSPQIFLLPHQRLGELHRVFCKLGG